jgi:hypothetical protein
MQQGIMGMPPGAPLINMRGEVVNNLGVPMMHGFPQQPGMHGMMMNPPPGMMMQQGLPLHMGQSGTAEDLGKRGRESGELLPADEFLQQFPGDITVSFGI